MGYRYFHLLKSIRLSAHLAIISWYVELTNSRSHFLIVQSDIQQSLCKHTQNTVGEHSGKVDTKWNQTQVFTSHRYGEYKILINHTLVVYHRYLMIAVTLHSHA